ncbi:aminotransferase class V-fold PLP-dependent enzyme [Maribacter sp. 2210JD10-5]|uniref:aminotransferase class V-fold PLP-dependent enzyme n=1 Tax=Maribacter sp. 2210JD10-5 TaxID=3386272 RepID=UPI0039BD3957
MTKKSWTERHFEFFRKGIIGQDQVLEINGKQERMIYADWTASGRLYWPIEETMVHKVAPWVANTHTETSLTGATMTKAYQEARQIIKSHVNASNDDVLISCGTGMTGAMNKLLRILGLRVPEQLKPHLNIPEENRPVVFLSHMEHHSNHTPWLETLAKVQLIPHTNEGLIDLKVLEKLLMKFPRREKIVSITACSNVTGIALPYHKIAGLAHQNNALCFVDFACNAPYVNIDMHPNDTEYLDAITFSPHKFLGGPGSSGVLIFNKSLYKLNVPDNPGGGTVVFTDPWGNHRYKKNIEEREDGGTPGFLQTIRTALAIRLKEKMGVEAIMAREEEINTLVFQRLERIEGIHLLAAQHKKRLSIFSFYLDGLNYDLVVKLLNDKFGIQTRGGCSCAGTYGHYLMNINEIQSQQIMKDSENGCVINKPGWVRISFHPTMTDTEIEFVCDAVQQVAENAKDWKKEYRFTPHGYVHKNPEKEIKIAVKDWFNESIMEAVS